MSQSRILARSSRSLLVPGQSPTIVPKYTSSLDSSFWNPKDVCDLFQTEDVIKNFLSFDFRRCITDIHKFIDYFMFYIYRTQLKQSKYISGQPNDLRIGFLSSSFDLLPKETRTEVLHRSRKYDIVIIPFVHTTRMVIVYNKNQVVVYRLNDNSTTDENIHNILKEKIGIYNVKFIRNFFLSPYTAVVPDAISTDVSDVSLKITDSCNVLWMFEVIYRLLTFKKVLGQETIFVGNRGMTMHARQDWTLQFFLKFLCHSIKVLS